MSDPEISKNDPKDDISFIIEELIDKFNSADNEKMRLESMVGSRFHGRVLNAARYLGLWGK